MRSLLRPGTNLRTSSLDVLKLLGTTAREDIPFNKADQLTLISDRQQRNRNVPNRLLYILEFRVRLDVDGCAALPIGDTANISSFTQECCRNGSRRRGGTSWQSTDKGLRTFTA